VPNPAIHFKLFGITAFSKNNKGASAGRSFLFQK
jgi:hypothetical protein